MQIDGISLKASPVLYRQKLGYISEKCPFFMEESVASNGLTYGEFYPDWSVRDYSAYLDETAEKVLFILAVYDIL